MQKAIEKLVRNEIGTQEKIELVHDLAVLFCNLHPHNCNVYRKDQVLKSFLNLMNQDIIMNIMR